MGYKVKLAFNCDKTKQRTSQVDFIGTHYLWLHKHCLLGLLGKNADLIMRDSCARVKREGIGEENSTCSKLLENRKLETQT